MRLRAVLIYLCSCSLKRERKFVSILKLLERTQCLRMSDSVRQKHVVTSSSASDSINMDQSTSQIEGVDQRLSESTIATHDDMDDACRVISKDKEITGPSKATKGNIEVSELSRRQQRAKLRTQKYKEMKRKAKEASGATNNQNPGFTIFNQTEYYFENGFRKVYPYYHAFSVYAKGRWIGRTLSDVFAKEFISESIDYNKEVLESGKILVCGEQKPLDYKLKNHDLISNRLHRHEVPVSDEKIEVIADNDDVIVVNKPSSIPIHPCGRYRYNSLVFILGHEMGYKNLRTLYRLDRLTSGVVIFTKNNATTKKYVDEIANRMVEKVYVCRVEGEFPEGEVICEQPIFKLSFKLGIQRVGPDGKESKTTFYRMSFNGVTSVVKCKPHTGRTHQIRVHLQYLGHPIVNDNIYNSYIFGPEKGKGGNYQKTDEELEALLLSEHNREIWKDVGENPDFYKRIAELKKEKESADSQCLHDSSREGVKEPDCKRFRTHMDTQISGTAQGMKISESSENIHITESSEKTQTSESSENAHISDSGNTHVSESGNAHISEPIENAQISESSKNKQNSKQKTYGENCNSVLSSFNDYGADTTNKHIGQRAFNWSKWFPDESCAECRRTYKDPTQMKLYLHALKYKGSDWEYTTSMPSWAMEDWKEDT